jgi:ribosomal protein S12 methylthiotransferase accessory factor
MKLETTYLNEHLELFEPMFGENRAAELRSAVGLYNRHIGPITSLNIVRPDFTDLDMYSAYCHHTPVESLMRDVRLKAKPSAGLVPGGGKGANLLRPVLGALGEMAERLLGMLHFSEIAEDIWFGSYEDLKRTGRNGRAPHGIPLFADEQYDSPGFEFARFTPKTPVGWIEGRELLSDEPVWIPAQLVLMYYRPRLDEANIGYATTAGLAFQTSKRAALIHGFCEVIERDALNIRWYSRLVPNRVDVAPSSVLEGYEDVARPNRHPRLELGIYDLTLDSPVPVLAAIGIDPTRRDRVFVGGTGAATSRVEALAQALFELGQCQTGFHFEDPFGRLPILPDADPQDVVEFFDAPLYYGHLVNTDRLKWFMSALQTHPWSSLQDLEAGNEQAYDQLLAWAERQGFRPVVFDFGAACPGDSSITKIYIPELTHACPPRNPMLGHPRFRELPRRLGASDTNLSFPDLTTDPIPFA